MVGRKEACKSPMIGFVGLSHRGMDFSIAAAAKGFNVLAYDADAALCKALQQGNLPLGAPGLAQSLAASRERIHYTSDVAELSRCGLIYSADDGNHSNLADFVKRLEEVASLAASGTILVILSQVPPGFTRTFGERQWRVRPDLKLYYQAETLVFDHPAERVMQPERFLVGCADPGTPLPDRFAGFLDAFQCPIMLMGYESAELAKTSINMCLAASMTTADALAELCEAVGADWAEITPILKLDRRIGPHACLSPGLGIADGSLERNLVTVQMLAREHGTDASIVDAWLTKRRTRHDWVLRTLHTEVMARIPTPVIAVWGIASEPGTTSTKGSPALALLDDLRAFAVRAYDPLVRLGDNSYPAIRQTETALAACVGADVLAIMTPWTEFSSVAPRQLAEEMRGRVLIDPFSALDHRKYEAMGFTVHRRGASAWRRAA